MQLQAILTRPLRTAAVFTCALLASLALLAAAQAETSHAGTPRITAGYSESCGVTSTGEGRCWGPNANGEGTVPTGKTWASISTGEQHSCGVTTTGEGLCWGVNVDGQTNVPTGKTWASITAGTSDSCGVTTTGEGLCWGAITGGWGGTADAAPVPEGKTWESINAGDDTMCGVTKTGEGLCWTDPALADPAATVPTGKTWASITGPDSQHTCGVTTSGEGLCWGNNDSDQSNVPDGKIWASMTVGPSYSCGVTTTGEGLCWGRNEDLQGGLVGNTVPPTGKTWASIDAGRFHTCGVTTVGEGLCWGYDGHEAAHQDNWTYQWVEATPADGRLDVPAGNYGEPVVSTDTTAPRLAAKVGLRVNLRTKVSTLTLKAVADRSQGDNAVTKLEYWNRPNRPKDSATPKPGFVRAYAPTVSLRPGQVAFWVRVRDSKGKWSGWYRTRF